jgi:hypothetical protein
MKYRSTRKRRHQFCDERVPSRESIHNLANKLRTTRILRGKKHKHKCQVLTEEKSDDIKATIEPTPRKSPSSRDWILKVQCKDSNTIYEA